MSFDKPKKTKRPGTDRRWTLLFIGDHGNVITLKRFKAIVLATVCVFLLAISALAVLIFLNTGILKDNQEFKKRIEDSREQIETLRHEKEILMARLVLSETKIKENISKGDQNQAQENTTQPIKQKFQAAPKAETPKVNEKKLSVPQTTQSVPKDLEAPDSKPVFSVAVENFIVSHEPDSANLSAQFKIKNTSPESQKVAGHAVVVLKNNELPRHKWLVMPAVGLVGDKPSGKNGKRFSIQRFRTMNLISRTPKHAVEFRTAAIYLPPLPVSKAQTPSADSASAETPSVKTPAAPTPSADTTSADTPSAETPSAETPLNETLSSEDLVEPF
jgi:hypothetical protein